ncbi:MAG TPA: hypothetical protein VHO48_10155 [Anaerolineaceae bacterium]|nr:hypothetical protein [Anaerolineaceae bacterium]
MDFSNPMTWKGLIFTVGVVLLFGGLTWWVYLSPIHESGNSFARPSPRTINLITFSMGVSAILMISGGLWDAIMHLKTGRVPGGSDFLWPPHLLLYSGFLLSMLVAIGSIWIIAVHGQRFGIHDPRAWIRDNPYLGAVALCATFTMLSIPGDAIWHELMGTDLTAWSPPHVLLALSSSAILISTIGIFLQQRFTRRTMAFHDLGIYFLLGLMLNILYMIAVLEWELPGERSLFVNSRPIWLYPSLAGIVSFFAIILATRLTQARFAATAVAAMFYLFRLLITTGISLVEGVAPMIPLPFFLGAFLIDLFHWEHIRTNWLRVLSMSLAYTIGYAVAVIPVLADRRDLPSFSVLDVVLMLATIMIGAAIFVPLSRYTSRRLTGRQPVH